MESSTTGRPWSNVALSGKPPYHVHPSTPEWRNWYTHQTQNLASFTAHVGSSPTSGTNFRAKFLSSICNSPIKPVGGDGDRSGDAEGNHVAKEPEFDRHFIFSGG